MCFTINVKGQDYVHDMLKIREAYRNYHSFKMKFIYCPYDSLSLVTDSMRARCYMTDNEYYYKINGSGHEYEYIKNSQHYIVIDHANKVVAIDKSSRARQEMWDIKKVDTLLASTAMRVKYKDLSNEEGEYDLTYGKGTWNRLKVVFNKTSYTLTSIIMYSPEKGKMSGQPFNKPRVGIYYSDYSKGRPDDNWFSDLKYVTSTGNKILPGEAYKGYKVLDYLNKN